MQRIRRSVLAVIAMAIVVSLSAAPRQPQQHAPRQRDTQQKQGSSNPWARLIHKILDDVIPPPDNRLSVPPG
jgi:hypothetical protein